MIGRAAPRKDPAADSLPIVIGHRGACGYVPEHTLTSYFIAMEQGADYVEPDLVMTKDGVLVARHENEIGGTTNVAQHPEFAARRCAKVIDGEPVTGWFTEDFTLAELKTLRARERIPQFRPANVRFDGQFHIPTFEEILALVQAVEVQRRATSGGAAVPRIGIYPETKHPSYFAALGLALERPLLDALERRGYKDRDAPIFIQSFEVGNLQMLSELTRIRLVQLMDSTGAPYDWVARREPRSYRDLVTPAGLREVARYADAIGVEKVLVIPRDATEALGPPTPLVEEAHTADLLVHAWTFRAENHFLPRPMRAGADPVAFGDAAAEVTLYLQSGLDGFFIDQPDVGARARDAFALSQPDDRRRAT
jgi:glycerophosphoryl diester phosphodiesterase